MPRFSLPRTLCAIGALALLAACSGDGVVEPLDEEAAQPGEAGPTSAINPLPLPDVDITGPARSHQNSQPVPASVIVSHNGLEWVWASPCTPTGCSGGMLVGKEGFNFATPAQWAMRPPVSAFRNPDKCAAPYFEARFHHCDWADGQFGFYGSSHDWWTGPNGGRRSPNAETWLVRGASDTSPPSIAANVSGTLGNDGWYVSDVAVSWTVTDGESEISSTDGCDAVTLTTDSDGTTYTCTATSDGGTNSASVTVKRDATDPEIGYSGNAGSYDVADVVGITCSASDAMSGLASDTCADIAGDAYTFGLGTTSFSATAEDNAGNSNAASGSFEVTASTEGLCALVERFVSHPGVANSLCAKTRAAGKARNDQARDGALGAFVNEVEAQSGKKIDADDAAVLITIANALMS